MFKKEQFETFNNQFAKSVDAQANVISATLEAVKQLTFVNCEAARSLCQVSVDSVKALYGVKNAEQFTQTVQNIAVQSLESGLNSSKKIADVVNASTATLNGVAQTALKDVQETVAQSVDKLVAVNPTLSKVANDSLQTFIATSNQAADAVAKVSQQVASATHKNLEAATEVAIKNVKKAATAN